MRTTPVRGVTRPCSYIGRMLSVVGGCRTIGKRERCLHEWRCNTWKEEKLLDVEANSNALFLYTRNTRNIRFICILVINDQEQNQHHHGHVR